MPLPSLWPRGRPCALVAIHFVCWCWQWFALPAMCDAVSFRTIRSE